MRGNNNNSASVAGVSTKSNLESNLKMEQLYLCNFRVISQGDWLCLKELQDLEIKSEGLTNPRTISNDSKSRNANNFGIIENAKCEIVERDWVNYYCRCFSIQLTQCLVHFFVSKFL